jgi:hypothetical protein
LYEVLFDYYKTPAKADRGKEINEYKEKKKNHSTEVEFGIESRGK